MYVTDLVIEQVGPITHLDVRLPFHEDGRPKPLVLVGTNGSGKTIAQATIADALVLLATSVFQDVVPRYGLGHAFWKLGGSVNQRIGSNYNLALVEFQHEGQHATYVDKSGTLQHSHYNSSLQERFLRLKPFPVERNHKKVTGFKPDIIERVFGTESHCFFPATRRESPHWLNQNVEAVESPTSVRRLKGELNKPIIVEECREENKRWLLDLILDCRSELEVKDGRPHLAPFQNFNDRMLFKTSKDNVDTILEKTLRIEGAKLLAGYRNISPRIAVHVNGNIVIPGLDHFSMGQSVLFNLLCTIVRYSDRFDPNKSITLDQIKGVVLIDEIDSHLHSDLQCEVLPSLLRLLPGVQFIISTHSPLVLMGMRKAFGEDGFSVIEMPNGEPIDVERFSEFEKSFSFYKATSSFEQEVARRAAESTQPMVLLEGDTDRDYIKTALEVLGRSDLVQKVIIDWIGTDSEYGATNGGKDALAAAGRVLRRKPKLLQQKILLLYDCEVKIRDEVVDDKLYIRKIPLNDGNAIVSKGIENLLPPEWTKDDSYFRLTKKPDGCGGGADIRTLDKRKLCDAVCKRRDPEDFRNFSSIVAILEEFLGLQAATPSTHLGDIVLKEAID